MALQAMGDQWRGMLGSGRVRLCCDDPGSQLVTQV